MTTLNLWNLLRKRSAGRSDPQRLTGILAIIAFAVTTAISLVVLGGWRAFSVRAVGAMGDADVYPAFAAIASVLLLIPLYGLGAAAARLAMARRDERLAALRLAGATTRQVYTLTLLDAASQALIGAVIGAVTYFGLIPIVQLVVFQGRPFGFGELVVPPWVLPVAVIGVVAIALVSAASSLRKVVISPLGVARRVTPARLHWSRVIPLAVAAIGFAVAMKSGNAGFVVLLIFLGGGLAVLNLIGPLVIMVLGRMWAARARTPEALIAARRLIDNPKNAWRTVGGVGLATFIAGLTATVAAFSTPDDPDPFLADMARGGLLTLVITAVVAAVSTGVLQAGRVIDQRSEYRAMNLAGMDMKRMNKARNKETQVPLLGAIALGSSVMVLFVIPVFSASIFAVPAVLWQYALSIVIAALLVIAGAAASGIVLKTVVATD